MAGPPLASSAHHSQMSLSALPLAFVPAAGFLALRSFLKAYPSSSTEGDIQFVLRGLKLAAVSAAALPPMYIAFNLPSCHPLLEVFGKFPFLVFAVAGNGVNLFAIFDCLRERGGAGLLTAFFLAILQLFWLFTAGGLLLYRH